jgi:hypothetical protein
MLHLVALLVVPGFLALAWWQLDRALSGNSLSWAYTFEWPFFAGYGVFVWWRLVHDQRHRGEVPALVGDPESRPVGWALGSGRADRRARRAGHRAARPTVAEMAALALAEAAAEEAAGAAIPEPATLQPATLQPATRQPADARPADPRPAAPEPVALAPGEAEPASEEDRALAEYNAYLAALSASGKRKRW